MLLDEARFRGCILSKLHQWLQITPDPDAPLMVVAGIGHEAITPRQLVQEVEHHTEAGEQFVQRWLELALDHVMEADLDVGSDA